MKSVIPHIALAAGLAIAASASATPVKYSLDPTHTQVIATWSHLGFSKPAAVFVIGNGTLNWDADNPAASSVSVEIALGELTTTVPALDRRFLGEGYFDVGKYPVARFESTAVAASDKDGHFTVTGTLTIKDVSKPVTLDAVLNGSHEHPMRKVPAIGFDATGTLKRSDFGLDAYPQAVADEIELRITTEAFATAKE
ncbi:MAG: YceI family protein [Xanthomonadales bacterium]|nr:YceI family protein [Xanthomonadales bacterium]